MLSLNGHLGFGDFWLLEGKVEREWHFVFMDISFVRVLPTCLLPQGNPMTCGPHRLHLENFDLVFTN